MVKMGLLGLNSREIGLVMKTDQFISFIFFLRLFGLILCLYFYHIPGYLVYIRITIKLYDIGKVFKKITRLKSRQ